MFWILDWKVSLLWYITVAICKLYGINSCSYDYIAGCFYDYNAGQIFGILDKHCLLLQCFVFEWFTDGMRCFAKCSMWFAFCF